MVKQFKQYSYKTTYRFHPTHDHRKVFGRFEVFKRNDKYEIWNLHIKDDEQHKGYGTQMLKEFLYLFNADKPLFLYVRKQNEIAIRLYKKVGFAIVGDYDKTAYAMQYMNK